MMAIEKSYDGLSPPPKLLISHGLPVLSGRNPQVVRNHPGSTTTPTTPPQKKKGNLEPPPTQKKQKQKTQGPREKIGKKKRKKEGAIFANPPSEDPLVDEPLWEKARKAWPTAAIHNEIFEFSEIYICQKY